MAHVRHFLHAYIAYVCLWHFVCVAPERSFNYGFELLLWIIFSISRAGKKSTSNNMEELS